MKNIMLFAIGILAVILFASCARGITNYDAANGKAKCGCHLR